MNAVKRAVKLAQSEKAEVTLMSVAPYSKDDFDEMWPSIQDKLEAQAADALKKSKAVFDEKGIKADAVLEAGVNPANMQRMLSEMEESLSQSDFSNLESILNEAQRKYQVLTQ